LNHLLCTLNIVHCYLVAYYICLNLLELTYFQEVLERIRQKLMDVLNRNRHTWSRSPLNVAVCKMRIDVVRMMIVDAGFDVNSVDEINRCQR
jgi:hypothetical protein